MSAIFARLSYTLQDNSPSLREVRALVLCWHRKYSLPPWEADLSSRNLAEAVCVDVLVSVRKIQRNMEIGKKGTCLVSKEEQLILLPFIELLSRRNALFLFSFVRRVRHLHISFFFLFLLLLLLLYFVLISILVLGIPRRGALARSCGGFRLGLRGFERLRRCLAVRCLRIRKPELRGGNRLSRFAPQ